ncbi:MAG: hypothetical protein GKR89_32205 [Candidatus Latescibacteria bacterium]|nr:hypothetical protein [Candidatus Latescibacterota bacterium]
MRIYRRYAELLQHVQELGRPQRVLGRTLDGSPVVAVKSGGDKTPAIFISAGTHSTEHAGVSAAVALIEGLDTEHQVWTIPTRDPVGLNGYGYALSLGLGAEPEIESFDQVEDLLRAEGEVLFEEDGMLLALVGEYGYTCSRPAPQRTCPQWAMYLRLQQVEREEPAVLEALKGRRIYMTPGQAGVEGTGDFGRAYTLVVSPAGELLHLNRFHDTAWAPAEARCARNLMAEIRPGISFDLHESQLMGDRYWLSARHQADAEDEAWEQKAAGATIAAVAAAGAVLAADDDVLGGVPLEETWFTKTAEGVYWLDANVRGEGLNLMDFASRHYGLAFGTEMGMYGSFEERVKLGMQTVESAVAVFAERYR